MAILKYRPISVIVPTFNRASVLKWCLEHLENQSFQDFNVIIVDDGSTDDTAAVAAWHMAHSSLEIVYARQENAGPAKARNTAVGLTRSPLCLFIGDDILCTSDFVAGHYQLHRDKSEMTVCGLGLTRWDSDRQELTPFMKVYERVQFAYSDLLAGARPNWRHFYTSNLSVKTELLRRHPFDERFCKAAMEDLELGYRISRFENLTVDFLPHALAFHYHPTTLRQACRRSVTIGWSLHLFEQCWPDADLTTLSGSRLRKLLKYIVGFAPIRLPLIGLSSCMETFYCSTYIARALLGGYSLIGYRKRDTELRLTSARTRAA